MVRVPQNEREAVIGPFQLARLSGVQSASNVDPFVRKLPVLNVANIWLSTALQAGVEKFEVMEFREFKIGELPKFIRSRVHSTSFLDFADSFFLVYKLLGIPVNSHEGNQERPRELNALLEFLVELILASRKNKSLIFYRKLPTLRTLEDVRPLIPEEAFFAVRNLMAGLETLYTSVVTTKRKVGTDDLLLFEEIATSAPYKEYSRAQAALEDPEIPVEKVDNSIQVAGRGLLNYKRVLKLKRVGISLLPLSASIIEATFGKVSGKVASALTELMIEWVNPNSRTVIYEFDDMIGQTMRSRIDRLIHKS